MPEGLRAAVLFVPKKSPRPIESGLRLVAGDDGIQIVGGISDPGPDRIDGILSTAFRARMPSNDSGAVADIVIPRGAAESWGKNKIETVDVDGAVAAAGGMRAPVECGAEFPRFSIPAAPSAVYSLQFQTFKAIAEHIGSATDTETSRYALGGIFMESGAGCVRFVGTDGRRLHVVRIDGTSDGAFSVVIPAAVWRMAVKAIDRTIDGRGAAKRQTLERLRIVVSFDDSNGRGAFSWSVGNCNYDISWKKIDGRFPGYRDVFPEFLENAAANVGHVDREEIVRHAETCRKTVCTANSKGVKIYREAGDAGAFISARAADTGEYCQPVKGFLPVSFSRLVDPAFLADALKAAAAFDAPAGAVAVWSNPENIGTAAAVGDPVFLGKAGSIFAADETRPAVFAAVIMPLAID